MWLRRRWVSLCGAGLLSRFDQLCHSEVEYFGFAAYSNENVRRLDVPVNNPVSVGRVQRIGDLNRDIEQFTGWQAGVRRILEMLRDELSLAMSLSGQASVSDIDRSLVRPAPGASP